jgi:hypothetical protein
MRASREVVGPDVMLVQVCVWVSDFRLGTGRGGDRFETK